MRGARHCGAGWRHSRIWRGSPGSDARDVGPAARRVPRPHPPASRAPAGEQDAECRLRAEILDAERRVLVRLRNEGAISDDVLRELEQELDLEALRIGAGEQR